MVQFPSASDSQFQRTVCSESRPSQTNGLSVAGLLLDQLAEEFVSQLRDGFHPSITQYMERYPDLADEIRDVFPTVAAMEGLHQHTQQSAQAVPPLDLKELGDFRIIGEIGRGGMGVVYEAEQVTLGRRVAVKVLPKTALKNPLAVQRFRRESQTAAKLHHTNIVPVFGVGEQDGYHYIVMQLIQGMGLDEIMTALRELTLPQRPLTDEEGKRGESKGDDGNSSDSTRSRSVQRTASDLLNQDMRSASPTTSLRASARPSEGSEDLCGGAGLRTIPTHDSHERGRREASSARRAIRPEYWRNVARIGIQAAWALNYAHASGTLHRDLKPANLLLDDRGVVWMADFGLAKAVEDDHVTWTGDIVGTICYLAPERFDGVEDDRSDIYSLGLTLYELLTLEKAFSAKDRVSLLRCVTEQPLVPPRKIDSRIPRDLETIVLKAAARDPKDRYASAEALARDLESYLEGRPIAARRLTYFERGWRWCRRNPVIAAMTLFVIGAVTTSVLGVSHAYMREAAEHRRAEVTSQLALKAFDGIYNQLAPDTINPPAEQSDATDLTEPDSFIRNAPVSRNVAVVLTSLLDFYDQLSDQTVNNEQILMKSITAKRKVGDIQFQLNEAAKALTAYDDSLELWNTAQPHVAQLTVMQLELGRIHNGIGMASDSLNRHVDALGSFEHAISALKSIDANEPAVRYELAKAHLLHHVSEAKLSRGSREDRRQESHHLPEALSLLGVLIREFPDVPEYQLLMAKCYRANRISDFHHHECLPCAIEMLSRLVEKYPDSPDYRFELGSASNDYIQYRLWRLEQVLQHSNAPPNHDQLEVLRGLEKELHAVLDVIRVIEQDYPTVVQYLMLSTRLHHQHARILRWTGQLPAAIQEMNTVISKQRQVIRHAPGQRSIHEIWLCKFQLSLAKMRKVSEPHRAYEIQAELLTVRTDLTSVQDDPANSLSSLEQKIAHRLLQDVDQLLHELTPPASNSL